MIKLVILTSQLGRLSERTIKLSNTDLQQLMQLNHEETEELIKERYLYKYEELISFEWRIWNEDVWKVTNISREY